MFEYACFRNVYVKIHRKYHNPEAQPCRGTKRRRDEEQIMKKQTPHIKPPTHDQRETTTKGPP